MSRKKPATKTYMLRTCRADMTSHGGFVWPRSGPVEAPDWSPKPYCGEGLHGLLMGQGDGVLLDWSPDAVWLVVEVDPSEVVGLRGKVKVPRGIVVFAGDRFAATEDIINRGANRAEVVGGTATAGNYGTATAGDGGTATAGNYGTATAGNYGTATAGYGGTVVVKYHDGLRYRLAVGYVGENGIKPNTPYCVIGGNLVEKKS